MFRGSLPHSLEAEQGLLGALLADNRGLEQVGDKVRGEHFYSAAHGRIYDAILHMADRGKIASPVTLKAHFADDKELESVGGAAYLAELAGNVISLVNNPAYAEMIYDLYLRRRLIQLGDDAQRRALDFDLDFNAQGALEQTEEQLFALSERGQEGGPEPAHVATNSTLNFIEAIQKGSRRMVKTGIGALDDVNGGFTAPDLVFIGGRPSMGKTAFAMSCAYNMALSGLNTLFFSQEMSKEQLMMRLFARETGISTGMMAREGSLQREHYDNLMRAQQRINALPLFIDETGNMSVAQIRARARRQKRRHGLDAIFIDYLNIMKMPDKYFNKVDQIGEITSGLKALAKDLQVPVFCLAQLSRDVTKRENPRPQMSDLRDSGAIEQDADVILLLHRDEYYLERQGVPPQKDREADEEYMKRRGSYYDRLQSSKGQATIIIEKWRQGHLKDVKCGFDKTRQLFHDFDVGM